MKKILQFGLMVILLAIGVVACGTPAPIPATKEVSLGESQDVTFRAVSSQTSAKEVKIVFTAIVPGDETPAFYFQAFSDGELMKGDQKLFNDYNLFSGLTLQPKISVQQLLIEYNPELWEVMP